MRSPLNRVAAFAVAIGLLACIGPIADAQNVGISGCNAATLSVTGTSSNVQLSKCAPSALLLNVTSTEAFYVTGATSATAATTSNFSIPGNSYQLVDVSAAGQWIAAITATGTTTLRITQGNVR
jgi:hypothetical protein